MLDYDGSNTKVRICLFIGKNLQNIVSDGFLSYELAYSNFTLLVLWTDSFSNFSFLIYQRKSGNICLKMYQSLSSQLILWLILILCRYSQLVWLLVRLLVRLLVSKLVVSKFGDILGYSIIFFSPGYFHLCNSKFYILHQVFWSLNNVSNYWDLFMRMKTK